MCDQMRWDAGGFAGSELVKTPNLDKLADGGVHFENAYCASPVCSPARASWLTGHYPHSHMQLVNFGPARQGQWGCYMREDMVTIGDVLKDAGYRCGVVGPWHMGNDHIPQHGFEEYWCVYRYQPEGSRDILFEYFEREGVRNMYRDHPNLYTDFNAHMKYTATEDLREQRTTWSVDRSIDFLEGSDGRPFFLFLSIKDPHPQILAPENLVQLYPEDKIPLPSTWRDTLEGKPEFQLTEIGRVPAEVTDGQFRQMMAHYFALVTHIDNEVGRLFEELEKRGQFENSIIVFFSDHGEMLGEHGATTKRVLYDGSSKVPFIVSWPGG